MKPQLVAALYRRVSTAGQEDKTSLDSQLRECRQRAVADEHVVPTDLEFMDVMSGKSETRPGFMAMLAAARERKFDRLYVWALDRLGRTLKLSVNAVMELRDLGISVISCRDGDLTQPIVLGVLGGIAEHEHARIKARTWPPKLKKHQAGIWVMGKAPYGYRRLPEKGLTQCPIEAPIVRRIFNEASSGLGSVQIARRLNEGGIAPAEARVRTPKGKVRRIRIGHCGGWGGFREWLSQTSGEMVGSPAWQKSTVLKVLSNTMSAGALDGIQFKIDVGPIVSQREFEIAREVLRSRAVAGKGTHAAWLLTGLLECEVCRSNYQHHIGKGRFHYYRCMGKASGKSCTSKYVRVQAAHDAVIRGVAAYLRSAFPQKEFLSKFLTAYADRQIDNLVERRMDAEATKGQREEAWRVCQSKVLRLVDVGLDPRDYPELGRATSEARHAYEEAEVFVGRLTAEIVQANAKLKATREETEQLVSRVFKSLDLVEIIDGAAAPLTDLRSVLRVMVERAVVRQDRSIVVYPTRDPEAFFRLITDLGREKLVELRRELVAV